MSDLEEESFEVEEIRDKRKVIGGGWLYNVKWVGWESDTNTWEPPEHLEACESKVDDFERKLARKAERREARRGEEKEKREKKNRQRRERELANANRLKKCTSESDKEVDINHNEEKVENKNVDHYSDEKKEKEKALGKNLKKKSNILDTYSSDSSTNEEKSSAPILPKGKYIKDQMPSRIIGVSREPPLEELYFCVEFKNGDGKESSPIIGLISAKEAYKKIPQMCLQFYEKHLVWGKNKSDAKAVGS